MDAAKIRHNWVPNILLLISFKQSPVTGGWSGSTQTTGKVTATEWGTCANIPPLSHYASELENDVNTKPEELLALTRCGAQGHGFDSREGGSLFTSSIPC